MSPGLAAPFALPLACALAAALLCFAVVRLLPQRLAGRLQFVDLKAARFFPALVCLIALADAGVFGWMGIRRFQAMSARMTDLAIIDQVVWTALHGQFMRETIFGNLPNFLAYHFEPLLVLLAPLDLVFSRAGALVAMQAVALAAAAIPIGLWAREKLRSATLAVLVVVAYLLNLVLAHSFAQFVHETPLAIPLLAAAFYFQLHRRWRLAFLFAILAMACKEEIPFTVAAMGLYAVLVQRVRWAGLTLFALAVLWTVAALGLIVPHFNHGEHLYYTGDFSYLGDTPLTIALGVVTHPWQVLQHVATPNRVYFILFLLAPLGFLPLLGWRIVWIGLPTLAYLLLDNSASHFDPSSWYGAPIVPFLYFAAIEGIDSLRRRMPGLAPATYLTVVAALSYYWLGVGPGTHGDHPEDYRYTAHDAAAEAMMATIPPEASVSATTNLIAHLSRRMEIHQFPEVLVPTDIFAVDLKGWDGWHGYPASFDDYDQGLRRILRDPAYGASYRGDGLVLIRRGARPAAPQHSSGTVFGGQLELEGYDGPAVLQPGERATIHLHWLALAQPTHAYTISLQFGTKAQGKLVQRDEWPWEGFYPTTEWQPGQRIDDPHILALPAALPAGQYVVSIGVYSQDHGQILTLPPASGPVTLGPLRVDQ